jgi:hypothetical protein
LLSFRENHSRENSRIIAAPWRRDRRDFLALTLKSYKNLYPQITSFANLELAWRKARKGKRGKEAAARFDLDVGTGIDQPATMQNGFLESSR